MFKFIYGLICFFLLNFFFTLNSFAQSDINEGINFYKVGNYTKAESIFRNLIIQDPQDYSAVYMLAATLVNKKKYGEAQAYYRKIIENSNDERLVNLCVQGLHNLGQKEIFTKQQSTKKAVIDIATGGSLVIVNNVIINDTAKYNFGVDTGATFTTLSSEAASRLNIPIQRSKMIRIMTGNGYINVPLVKISKIELQGLEATNVDAVITDLASNLHEGKIIAGLLGLSFLNNFKMTLDRANGQMILEKNQ
jgi:clan AA aspartic protease (TIGR02281 family)